MSRKKILLQTNSPFLKTGLAINGRNLAKYLVKTGKYDLVYYCTNNTLATDPNLARLPYKAYGCIPADQNIINQINANPIEARAISYGSYFIDQIVKEEKPDIWLESDDIWSTSGYTNKPWFNKIHSILHKTVDSVPVLDEAYSQALSTPNYFVWADFAAKEMKKRDSKCAHVRRIYGMMDTNHFTPITKAEKEDLRRRFGVDKNAVVFLTVNRNQYRKHMPQTIEAFALFKKEFPYAKAKIHFHTSFAEKNNGWDLPKLAQYYGVNKEDLLCTYVCKHCNSWHIAPYNGEDVKCPSCKSDKSCITANTQYGVPDNEMRYMMGFSDAGISAFNSGGLEYMSVTSLLCGLPTAITNYSCGEDFAELPFVYPIAWTSYNQENTNFIKAASNPLSIKNFMSKIYKATVDERLVNGQKGREWAAKTFSVETIGKQWEEVFDALPPKDWSSIVLTPEKKNDKFQFPSEITDVDKFIKSLYNNILCCEPDPDGFKYWHNQISAGGSREAVYNFFIKTASDDNAKNEPAKDFSELFDKNDRKRILLVIKEKATDVFLCTSLFKGLKDLYPDADLYVGVDARYVEVLAGNPHVHKIVGFHPAMESELTMLNYVDYYYYPALATQKMLAYLSKDKIGLEL